MVRVKICGLREPAHALAAARLGADLLGLVFAPSRRQVSLERAMEIADAVRRGFPHPNLLPEGEGTSSFSLWEKAGMRETPPPTLPASISPLPPQGERIKVRGTPPLHGLPRPLQQRISEGSRADEAVSCSQQGGDPHPNPLPLRREREVEDGRRGEREAEDGRRGERDAEDWRTRPLLVGVFVNQPVDEVNGVASACGLDVVQLSGDETPEYCQRLNAPFIKALRLTPEESEAGAATRMDRYLSVQPEALFLLDTHLPGSYGGTGQPWDWERAALLTRRHRILLAGGLTPENVAGALRATAPWGVDVSSGVETDGTKDEAKLRAFIDGVRTTERRLTQLER